MSHHHQRFDFRMTAIFPGASYSVSETVWQRSKSTCGHEASVVKACRVTPNTWDPEEWTGWLNILPDFGRRSQIQP
jgi:hypothetical protein